MQALFIRIVNDVVCWKATFKSDIYVDIDMHQCINIYKLIDVHTRVRHLGKTTASIASCIYNNNNGAYLLFIYLYKHIYIAH